MTRQEVASGPILMTVTPDLAREWLGANSKNRPVKKSTVAGYARDMAAGRWLVGTDAIGFNQDGTLLNGQHRLLACVKSETPFQTYVVRGLEHESMRVLDHGVRRKVGDQISIEGGRYGHLTGSAGRWLYIFKHGASALGKGRITESEILDMVDRHPRLDQSAGAAYGCIGVRAGLLAAVHYVGAFLLNEEEEAGNFTSVFVTGTKFYDDDAAHCWRERLIRMKQGRSQIAEDFCCRGTIHAWNNFMERIPVKTARVPEIIDFHGLNYKLL
jgi:hypothetical protein